MDRIDTGEVVVRLIDGWTLRSGCTNEDLVAGEYVRLCTPVGEEYLYWHYDEWADDPVVVMGAIMNAAGGFRPLELRLSLITINTLGSKWSFDQDNKRYRRTPLDGQPRDDPQTGNQGGPLDDNVWHPYVSWDIDSSNKLTVNLGEGPVVTAPEAYVTEKKEDGF